MKRKVSTLYDHRLQLRAVKCGAGGFGYQRKICDERAGLFQRIVLPQRHKIVISAIHKKAYVLKRTCKRIVCSAGYQYRFSASEMAFYRHSDGSICYAPCKLCHSVAGAWGNNHNVGELLRTYRLCVRDRKYNSFAAYILRTPDMLLRRAEASVGIAGVEGHYRQYVTA